MLFLILITICLLSGCSDNVEPAFNGIPLSAWVDSLYQNNEQAQIQALGVISRFGIKAGKVKNIITDMADGHLEGMKISPAVREEASRTLRLIGGAVLDPDSAIHQAKKMEWVEALGPHAKVVVEHKVDENELREGVYIPLSAMMDALYTTDIKKQILILKRIEALGPDAHLADQVISNMAQGRLRDMAVTDTVKKVAADVLKKIQLPPHMALNNTQVVLPTPSPDRFKALLDSFQSERDLTLKKDPRAPMDILLDSAKQCAWMGDSEKAITILQKLIKSDTLNAYDKARIEYVLSSISQGKESISVKKQ